MMATHGSGPLRRLLLGSVTAQVLHDVDCPVWTAVHVEQGPTVEWITPSVIVCAIDLDQDGEKTLRWASGIAAEYKAKLALVHVVPRLDSPGEGDYAERYRLRVSEGVNQRIEELQRKLETRAEVQLEAGDVERAVCSAASRLHANLLVIGRGLSGAPRLRTHTYAIIRDSPCPVVSV